MRLLEFVPCGRIPTRSEEEAAAARSEAGRSASPPEKRRRRRSNSAAATWKPTLGAISENSAEEEEEEEVERRRGRGGGLANRPGGSFLARIPMISGTLEWPQWYQHLLQLLSCSSVCGEQIKKGGGSVWGL
ncbi:uncharacterized protein LOC109708380 [Ananas comosus]|uniref:Uncharacterized protein LOC109708380 n=1 Tax=Ananas comosus TaxID=4615 RepID=A0A6P5EQ89_ANACO|nr:uncharacterized protein LOC109708380 [Ananas comosus]